MRIVVSGLVATYPLGGVFWDYFQYVQGLTELGHEVLYLEDTGRWIYDPSSVTMLESGEESARWLSQQVAHSLPAQQGQWVFRDARGASYGAETSFALDFCRTADLFLNISGATILRPDEFPRARTIYIDSDPMYSQASVPEAISGTLDESAQARLQIMKSYDKTYSFGENIGRSDCLVPSQLFTWRPTRQPILVDMLQQYHVPARSRNYRLSTIGSWEAYKKPLKVDGRRYYGKRREFLRYIGLAEQSPIPLELALSGNGPSEAFRLRGWALTDPASISVSAESYLSFLARSFAEWSVAKHAYVASNSGWFSGRSAIYLALAVPAIVQDTGFSRFLPTGDGLVSFSTQDEALAAIQDVVANYERHCNSALEIAHEYFAAERVLSQMIDDAFASTNSPVPSGDSANKT